jgi:hypothetical protein
MSVLPLVLLLLVALVTCASAQPRQIPACSFFAGPQGSGTTCSDSSPCTVQEGIAHLGPGKTLCLLDGVYRGSSAMISTPSTLHGSAESPIWIRANTEGQAIIDGEDVRRPIHLDGTYIKLHGFDTLKGDNHNVRLMGKYLQVLRVVAYDTGAGGDGNINIGGSYNLVEDCVALGPARKHLPAGASSGGPGNVIRRCVAVWSSNTHTTSNPTNAAEVGYGQDQVTLEQNVLSWITAPGGRVTEPEGVLQVFATRNSRILGNLFLVHKDATFNPNTLVRGFNDGGSHAQAGDYHNTQNLDMRWNVSYADPLHPKFPELSAYRFTEATDGGPHGTNNQLRDSVGVSGQPISMSTASWLPPVNMQWGTSLAAAIGAGKSMWTDSVASPGICTRLLNGQASTEPLWPWAMQARITTAQQRWGLPLVDVTQAVETMLGVIPAQCKTGSAPVPPDPTPTPPGPHPATVCTGELGAKGVLQMRCVPEAARR